jgi:transposase-like protein
MWLHVAQHFLLAAAARQLSLARVARMSEDDARGLFRALRWHATGGDPVCPHCGCLAVYEFKARPIFKCKACLRQFSLTSGTIFHSRKLGFRDHLLAIAIFVNGAKGVSALQLGRDLDVSYKTAFVMAHKLREALAAENARAVAAGHVEVDGAHFGGSVKPANHKANRRDRRLAVNRSGGRKVVIVMRERGPHGRSLPFVVRAEHEAVPVIRRRVLGGSTVYADEAVHWDVLHADYTAKRINHTLAFSDDGACTNQAESFFSRLRRAELGQHHHIAGPYLRFYAGEMGWREDHRRYDNRAQWELAGVAALGHAKSRNFCGYWQRAA